VTPTHCSSLSPLIERERERGRERERQREGEAERGRESQDDMKHFHGTYKTISLSMMIYRMCRYMNMYTWLYIYI
jgi:hypothetical protein